MSAIQSMNAKNEALVVRHNAEIDALGEEVRVKVVGPFCERYGLDFIQGMGSYFFAKGKETYGRADDAVGQLRRSLEPVFELLDAEASDRHPLGFRVSDYRHGR